MINVNDIKNGMTVKIDNNIYTVVEFQHVKPGKGSAFVRTKLKNIRTGATTEITFNAGVKIETARVEKQNMQFLYSQGDTYYFMNMQTYDQIELNKSSLGDNAKFLKENLELELNKKTQIFKSKQGVNFCGYKINEYRLKIRDKGKRKLKKKVKELKYYIREGKLTSKEAKKYLAGHLGYLKIANVNNLTQKIFYLENE